MQTIKIGDRVRSFDFPHLRDVSGDNACYVVGTVLATDKQLGFGPPRYEIAVEFSYYRSAIHPETALTVYPPMNGSSRLFARLTDGVERLPLALPHLTDCPCCKGSGSVVGAQFGGFAERLCCDLCEGTGCVDSIRL